MGAMGAESPGESGSGRAEILSGMMGETRPSSKVAVATTEVSLRGEGGCCE